MFIPTTEEPTKTVENQTKEIVSIEEFNKLQKECMALKNMETLTVFIGIIVIGWMWFKVKAVEYETKMHCEQISELYNAVFETEEESEDDDSLYGEDDEE